MKRPKIEDYNNEDLFSVATYSKALEKYADWLEQQIKELKLQAFYGSEHSHQQAVTSTKMKSITLMSKKELREYQAKKEAEIKELKELLEKLKLFAGYNSEIIKMIDSQLKKK